MRLTTQCCKDCHKRYSGCHSECPDYIAAKAESEQIRQQLIKEGLIKGYLADSSYKRRKRYLKK